MTNLTTPEHAAPEMVSDPQALIRLAATLRAVRDEVRGMTLDHSATERLIAIHRHLIRGVCETLSPDLKEELSQLARPIKGDETTDTLRLAQSQLLGWVEGLFLGLQASAAQALVPSDGEPLAPSQPAASVVGRGAGMEQRSHRDPSYL